MGKTVLIVDDSNAQRMVLKMSLEGAGHTVLEARNGQEALEMLRKTAQVNLIVSDVNMPVMNGLEFAAKVKLEPIHKFTPVLMLTTESGDEKKNSAKESGVKAWMVKPFSPSSLLSAVTKLAK